MTIQQVKTANRDPDTGTWSEGDQITLVPSQVIGVGENDGHAIIYTAAQPFYVWPNKAAVDLFLQNA